MAATDTFAFRLSLTFHSRGMGLSSVSIARGKRKQEFHVHKSGSPVCEDIYSSCRVVNL